MSINSVNMVLSSQNARLCRICAYIRPTTEHATKKFTTDITIQRFLRISQKIHCHIPLSTANANKFQPFRILQTEDRMFDLFKHGISDYLDDPDSQFIMDEIQKKFECCGAYTFNDWNYNAYFKCSSGDVLACGVPYSCCKTVSNSKAMEYTK